PQRPRHSGTQGRRTLLRRFLRRLLHHVNPPPSSLPHSPLFRSSPSVAFVLFEARPLTNLRTCLVLGCPAWSAPWAAARARSGERRCAPCGGSCGTATATLCATWSFTKWPISSPAPSRKTRAPPPKYRHALFPSPCRAHG